jgi:N-acetylglucosaminyldiphosphoundecaprenol N-acetyl-beta-D-mannosaminyltransferase
MTTAGRLELLGCPFDRVTMNAAVERCVAWCLGPRSPHTVVTMNAALLCAIRRDTDLRAACLAGDLIVADGVPVVWTSRLAGLPLPDRVAGVDMFTRLLEEASRRRLRVSFLGARRPVVEEVVRVCQRDHPGAVVAGARDGYFGAEDHDKVVAEIAESGAHMLFVGMPSPFKEVWCERHRATLGVPVIMGVGGSFDVLAGRVRRAPRLLQSLGLEWSWRLAMEPRKMWKRYLVTNSEYIWRATGEVLRLRTRRLRRQA